MQYFVKQMNTINRYFWDDLYFTYFWYDTNYVYWLYWQLSAIFPASWVWNETVSYNPAIVLPNDLSLLTTFVISPHRTTIKIFYPNQKYFIKPKNGKFTSLIHVNSQLFFESFLFIVLSFLLCRANCLGVPVCAAQWAGLIPSIATNHRNTDSVPISVSTLSIRPAENTFHLLSTIGQCFLLQPVQL